MPRGERRFVGSNGRLTTQALEVTGAFTVLCAKTSRMCSYTRPLCRRRRPRAGARPRPATQKNSAKDPYRHEVTLRKRGRFGTLVQLGEPQMAEKPTPKRASRSGEESDPLGCWQRDFAARGCFACPRNARSAAIPRGGRTDPRCASAGFGPTISTRKTYANLESGATCSTRHQPGGDTHRGKAREGSALTPLRPEQGPLGRSQQG